MTAPEDAWKSQLEALGTFIRGQRQVANLSLREMARLTDVSNAYLSQIERGLHQPSVRILRSVADALNVSAETLLAQAGLIDEDEAGSASAPAQAEAGPARTVAAILADPSLSPEQREALLSVYRSFSGDATGAPGV
ncbi:MAG: helix-turn-helix transcriptional regulator [Actinomycetota bacterium]